MRSAPEYVEDLLTRARQGTLSEGEERALQQVIGSSLEDRLLYRAGCALDEEGSFLPDDGARLERMVQNARRHKPKTKGAQRQRVIAVSVAVGMLSGAAVVSAFELSMRWLAEHREAEHARAPRIQFHSAPAPTARGALAAAPPPAAPAEPVRAKVVLPLSVSPRAAASEQRPTESALQAVTRDMPPPSGPPTLDFEKATAEPTASDSGKSAAALFAQASGARVRGDEPAAIALYRQLETAYPKSAEAATARQSLGMLYVQLDRADLALEQFRASRTSSSAVRAESLWGEALALAKLRRDSEQRQALEQLLANYPKSAYAEAARKRLVEIEQGTP
ncbi:MAG: hypothetical protein ABJB12_17200 [Pseudomonadota bacterium]